MEERDWKGFVDSHDVESINLNFIKNDIPFFEGKFYVVSKDFSIFIGEQEKFARKMSENFPAEDLMVGYLAKSY